MYMNSEYSKWYNDKIGVNYDRWKQVSGCVLMLLISYIIDGAECTCCSEPTYIVDLQAIE